MRGEGIQRASPAQMHGTCHASAAMLMVFLKAACTCSRPCEKKVGGGGKYLIDGFPRTRTSLRRGSHASFDIRPSARVINRLEGCWCSAAVALGCLVPCIECRVESLGLGEMAFCCGSATGQYEGASTIWQLGSKWLETRRSSISPIALSLNPVLALKSKPTTENLSFVLLPQVLVKFVLYLDVCEQVMEV